MLWQHGTPTDVTRRVFCCTAIANGYSTKARLTVPYISNMVGNCKVKHALTTRSSAVGLSMLNESVMFHVGDVMFTMLADNDSDMSVETFAHFWTLEK